MMRYWTKPVEQCVSCHNKRGKGAIGQWLPLHGEDRSQGQRIGQPEPLRQAGLNPPYSPGSPRFYDGRAKRGDAADEQTFLTGLICYPNLLRHGFAELSEPSLALCHRDQGEYDRAIACHIALYWGANASGCAP